MKKKKLMDLLHYSMHNQKSKNMLLHNKMKIKGLIWKFLLYYYYIPASDVLCIFTRIYFPITLCVRWPHIINDIVRTWRFNDLFFFFTNVYVVIRSLWRCFANLSFTLWAFPLFVCGGLYFWSCSNESLHVFRCRLFEVPFGAAVTALTDRPVQHKKPRIKVSRA